MKKSQLCLLGTTDLLAEQDEEPIEEFIQAVKEHGYDGVKFSYRQGKYRPNISGAGSVTEFVCFRRS